MKKLFFIGIILSLFSSCDVNDHDFSFVAPLDAIKIESIEINERLVTAIVVYTTSNQCWYYYKTERTKNDSVYTSKVFGKNNGNPCATVISSLKHTEKIIFSTGGEKTLRFWQNDSTYLDTTIVLQ